MKIIKKPMKTLTIRKPSRALRRPLSDMSDTERASSSSSNSPCRSSGMLERECEEA